MELDSGKQEARESRIKSLEGKPCLVIGCFKLGWEVLSGLYI